MNHSEIFWRQAKVCIVLPLASLVLFGCAADGTGSPLLGVEPWERGVLARDDMALDSSPLFSALDDHIYFSKEATSGGRGFSGGGCGCN